MTDRYTDRTYRRQVETDLAVFSVAVGETDLQISAARPLVEQARAAIRRCREPLERYLAEHSGFGRALVPWPCPAEAPEIVRRLCAAGLAAGVGPMAGVAGAVAQAVGEELAELSPEIIVENGGDIWLRSSRPRRIRLFAGPSPLSDRFALVIPPTLGLGICTSSASVGPSLSFGRADAATVLSEDAALADAAASTLGNLAQSAADIERALELVRAIPGVRGALLVVGDRLGAWGEVELEPLASS